MERRYIVYIKILIEVFVWACITLFHLANMPSNSLAIVQTQESYQKNETIAIKPAPSATYSVTITTPSPTVTISSLSPPIQDPVSYVASFFPDYAWALKMIQCESRGIQGAVNPTSGAFTMVQMLPAWVSEYNANKGTHYTYQDVQQSLEVTGLIGRYIYDIQGKSGWSCK